MQIEFQPGDYREIVCDLLAYPVFEEEADRLLFTEISG